MQELYTHKAGFVAGHAEVKKSEKYAHLAPTYQFQPVAIETSGARGPSSRVFLRELGRCVALETGEARSTSKLIQRLSVGYNVGMLPLAWAVPPPPN